LFVCSPAPNVAGVGVGRAITATTVPEKSVHTVFGYLDIERRLPDKSGTVYALPPPDISGTVNASA